MSKHIAAVLYVLIGLSIQADANRASRSLPAAMSCSVRIERTVFKERESQTLSYEVLQGRMTKLISGAMQRDGYAMVRPADEIRRWTITRTISSRETDQEFVSALTREFHFSAVTSLMSETLLLRIFRGSERAPIAKASTDARFNKDTNLNVKIETTSEERDPADEKTIYTRFISELICMAM